MPRQARKKSSSGIYHVMLRGIDRSTIFHDDEDCEKFLEVLRICRVPLEQRKAAMEASGSPFPSSREQAPGPNRGVTDGQSPTVCAKFFAYCLMGNHVHLLLQEGSESIQQIIKRIGVRYASFYNWKYMRTGHLFQDRFRSEPVEDDQYFLAVFRYIALNPVKAGISDRVGDYPWGSYHAHGQSGSPGDPGIRQGQSLSPGCSVTDGQSPTVDDIISPLPLDITPEQLDEFICSEQQYLNPFPERISDREAEMTLLQVTGLKQASAFAHLPKEEQKLYFAILQEKCLSVQQMARLTGVAKSNIARYLA